VNIIADLLERHAAEIPLWGHLPAALRLKEAAVQRLGVEAAFAAVAPVLGVPGVEVLRRMPLEPMAQVARRGGAVRAELWTGRANFLRAPPTTRFAPPPAPMRGRGRDAWLACFDEAVVRGRSSLLRVGERMLQDIEAGEDAFPDHPAYDPGLLHAEDGIAWMMQGREPALRVDEAFWLGGSHSVDFGHWVVDLLPKLMMARRGGLPAGVPVLVDAIIPATVREALPLLVPEGSTILAVPHLAEAAVGRLWCAPATHYTGFYPMEWSEASWSVRSAEPQAMATLLRDLRTTLGEAIAEPTELPRLFLARRPSRAKKKLLNAAAIEAIAEAHGFATIYPEDHSLVEQVRLAAHATHLLAPEGSNNLLAFFASAGARVATLNPPYTYPLGDVGAILAALGVDFEVLVGPDEPTEEEFCGFWNDYRIDEARFAAWLRDWA
jgi:capsular polysaccharide biosynthesis protein